MSTPVDPQRTPADAHSSVEPTGSPAAGLPADGGDGRGPGRAEAAGTAPTTRWSDAEVLDGHDGHSNTMHLPPVHADAIDRSRTDRQPQVDVRDSGVPTPGGAADRLDRDRDHDHAELVDRDRDRLADPDFRGTDDDSDRRALPEVVGATDRQSVVAREKERFGGMKFGSAFFGWLTATGLAVLLLAILAAAGVAFGVATDNNVNTAVQQSQNATGTAKTVGLIGAIVLLVILFVAYYCGGYVAGRMARFDGVKQGLGVWIWAIITSAIIAGVAALAGAKYNVLAQLNLPRIPVDEGSVTTVGIIAIVAAIVVALLGALLGGAIGTRYHRKVDAVGFDDTRR